MSIDLGWTTHSQWGKTRQIDSTARAAAASSSTRNQRGCAAQKKKKKKKKAHGHFLRFL